MVDKEKAELRLLFHGGVNSAELSGVRRMKTYKFWRTVGDLNTQEQLVYEQINAGGRLLLLIGIASYVLIGFNIYLMTRRHLQHFPFFQEAFSIILQDLMINTYMNGSFSAVPMEQKVYNIVHMEASSTHNSVASLNVLLSLHFCICCKLLLFPDRECETSIAISRMLITVASTCLFDIRANFNVALYKEF